MERNFKELQNGSFDVLVIGGGIYGAWIALDAALRGLKTAVVDKGDWACGTSTASTKLIHGGLRYLEHLRLDLVRSSLDERRQLTTIAPHRIKPLRFFIPLYDDNRVGPIKLKTGLWLYDLMAGKGQPVPPHARINREEAAKLYPFLDNKSLSGGYTYGDCQTDDFRLVLDIIDGAQRAGAVAVNYAKAVKMISHGRRVTGAVVQDLISGVSLEIHSRVVVNAAGPWVHLVDDIHLLSKYVRYSKGVHLVMPPLPTKEALLLMSGRDNRIFFIIPWYGKSLLGTTDSEYSDHPDRVRVEAGDVEYLLNEANRHLKGIQWETKDILGCFAGLRTLQNEPGKALSQVTREWSVIEPRPGLLVSIGGKYTSARKDAGTMVENILSVIERPNASPSPTAGYTLPSTPRADYKKWRKQTIQKAMSAGLSHERAAIMAMRFGAAASDMLALIADRPELSAPIHPDLPFIRAEVVYCAGNEMALRLEDLLRRRIPIVLLMRPDVKLAEELAALAAPEMEWSKEDIQDEVDHLMSLWTLPW